MIETLKKILPRCTIHTNGWFTICLLYTSNRDIRAANSLMQSIRSAIRGLQRWIADLNEKKQILLDALEQAKEPMLSDLLVDYFNRCV